MLLRPGLLGAAMLLFAGPVWAQPNVARDPVAAEVLFKEALALADGDNWPAACPKFRKSMELDPSPGTQANIARCAEREGDLAGSYEQLRQAKQLNLSTPDERRRTAMDRYIDDQLAGIEVRLPRLTITVAETIPGLTITRDGKPFSLTLTGEALPVNPGAHRVVATAEGYESLDTTVSLGEGARESVEIRLVKKPPGDHQPHNPPDVPPPDPPKKATPPSGPSPLFITGISGLIAGGVVEILGVTFVGLTASAAGDIPPGCTEALVCDTDEEARTANEASERGQTYSTVATAMVPIGAGLLGLGVALLVADAVTSPSNTGARSTPSFVFLPILSPDSISLQIMGPL
ncbi:MAG: hypothetical protein U0271_14245 [Polyangiaceae bacterium]